MKYRTLTVKVPVEMMRDLEAYALQEFPDECRKCQGQGVSDTGAACPSCQGTAVKGNISEATRYLLHFSLGQGASPEARAMMAAYSSFRSRFVAILQRMTHRVEEGLRQEVVRSVREIASLEG